MLGFSPSLLWIDLQMTGLNPLQNTIIQFACILSDNKLTKFQEGPHIVIHCDESILSKMDEWNTQHHKASGLYQTCLNSKISLGEAESTIIQYLKAKGVVPGQLVVAGNSVHQDKLFMFHHMPNLNNFLHYRILDVTSVKLVVNSFAPTLFFKKKNTHRALDDIKQSIGQLKFYIQHAFSF